MGSSNKHWPSMFKKSNYHNSQHGISSPLLSTGCDVDDRTPEPKPRWNPKPEQIRILEAIFNSGTMNPPREDIKKIREQLQEYGPISEANVFYWFQNRKSRSKNKHKHRHLNNKKNLAKRRNQNSSPPNNNNNNSIISAQTIINENVSVNQNIIDTHYFHTPIETDFQLPTPPFYSFPNMIQQLPQQNVDVPNLVNHEIFINSANRIPMNEQYDQGNIQNHEATMNIIMQQQEENPQLINLGVTSNSLNDDSTLPPLPPIVNSPFPDPFSNITQFQGVGEADDFTQKCIVSINNHIFKVDVGPFNIYQNFGNQVVLVDSSGQTIITDERGITLDSLQHGASYYLV